MPYMSLGDKREQSPLLLRYFEAPRGAEKRRDPRVSESKPWARFGDRSDFALL